MLTSTVVSLRLHAFEWDAARECVFIHTYTATHAYERARTPYKHEALHCVHKSVHTPHSEMRAAAEKCVFVQFSCWVYFASFCFTVAVWWYVHATTLNVEWFRLNINMCVGIILHCDFDDFTSTMIQQMETGVVASVRARISNISHFVTSNDRLLLPFPLSLLVIFHFFSITFSSPFIIPRALFLKFEINVVSIVVCLEPVSYIFVPFMFFWLPAG